jgi:hypothetical protein
MVRIAPPAKARTNALAGYALLDFEHGGKLVGLFTTFGFALAFLISSLD